MNKCMHIAVSIVKAGNTEVRREISILKHTNALGVQKTDTLKNITDTLTNYQ